MVNDVRINCNIFCKLTLYKCIVSCCFDLVRAATGKVEPDEVCCSLVFDLVQIETTFSRVNIFRGKVRFLLEGAHP